MTTAHQPPRLKITRRIAPPQLVGHPRFELGRKQSKCLMLPGYINAREKLVIVVGLEPYIFRMKVGGDNLYTTRSAEKGFGSLVGYRT